MTSIHDDGPGSSSDNASWRFQRLHEKHDALTLRLDELEAVLVASGMGYCRLNAGLEVLGASSQLKAEFGYAPDAAIEWDGLLSRVSPNERVPLDEAVRAALTHGTDVERVVHVQLPGRAVQPVALRGRTSGRGGQTQLILTASRAVSAGQDQIEALLARERQAREAAEMANRAKDEFLSVISHDLRSPLMAIMGWTRILAVRCRDGQEVSGIAPRIEQSAKAQMKIVNDLLDLARLNSGKLKIESRPMQLASAVREALEAARPGAAAKSIELIAQLDGAPGQLRGDPERLQQVVANLVSNAIKFTPSGGKVTVSLLELERDIELTVTDTGQGIEAELLPHVFDRALPGEGANSRQGGLGLGLTMVREIVSLHGGRVAAHSDGPGSGASFVVRLPVTQPFSSDGGEELPASQGQGKSLQGLSILVVDDVADARQVLAETLQLEGAQVTVTDSARAAYEQLENAYFDVMVTDIGMPEEDGYSLVRRMRKLRTGRAASTVAIAVTSYASKDDIAAAMEAGFDAHVPKPVDFDSFVALVRRLAGERNA